MYLDFCKAFDKVPHQRLLHKISQAGIQGVALNWIADFLANRRQRVVLREGLSNWKPVTSGVPQGSILGPTLFLIYVNDLPDSVQTTAKMFADDTKVYNTISSEDDCQRLQQDLDNLAQWSKDWLLSFNETKCVVLRLKKSIEF